MALLPACKNEGGTKRPEGILTQRQMINIQAGVHQTEAEISIRRMDFPVAKPTFDKCLDSILKTQRTDTGAYRRSFSWYAENVEEMDKVYQAVVDTLSLRESKMIERLGRRPVVRDSTQKTGDSTRQKRQPPHAQAPIVSRRGM
jgi:hypothetical protein